MVPVLMLIQSSLRSQQVVGFCRFLCWVVVWVHAFVFGASLWASSFILLSILYSHSTWRMLVSAQYLVLHCLLLLCYEILINLGCSGVCGPGVVFFSALPCFLRVSGGNDRWLFSASAPPPAPFSAPWHIAHACTIMCTFFFVCLASRAGQGCR